MRATVLIEPDLPLELGELSPRPPRPTEVYLRIDASGVCPSDGTVRRQGMGRLAPVMDVAMTGVGALVTGGGNS